MVESMPTKDELMDLPVQVNIRISYRERERLREMANVSGKSITKLLMESFYREHGHTRDQEFFDES